jgi:predicted Zn-dependent protease
LELAANYGQIGEILTFTGDTTAASRIRRERWQSARSPPDSMPAIEPFRARRWHTFRKAMEVRQALYAKTPDNTANRGALAECYANLGEYGKAIELLERLTAADPNNAQYRIQLASVRTQARLTPPSAPQR